MSEKAAIPWEYFGEVPQRSGWEEHVTVWNSIQQVQEYTARGIVLEDNRCITAEASLSTIGEGEAKLAAGQIEQIVTVTGEGSTLTQNTSGVVINITSESDEGEPMPTLIFDITVLLEFPRPGEEPRPRSEVQVLFGQDYRIRRVRVLDDEEDDDVSKKISLTNAPEVQQVLTRMGIRSPYQQLDPEATMKALVEQVTSMINDENDENADTSDILGSFRYRRSEPFLDGYRPLILNELGNPGLN